MATLRKWQQEEVEARAQAKGAEWQAEVAQAKRRVQAARRALEDEHDTIYQKVVAEHEQYMEGEVPYKSLRYIRELAEAGRPQEIRVVRLQDGRVRGNKREVLEEVAQSFRRQHNQEQQGLSGTTRRMVQALPRVFTEEQSEALHRSRVTPGEIKEAVRALKRKKRLGVDQMVAEAYQNLVAPEQHGLAGRVTRSCARASPQQSGGARCCPCIRKGITLRRGTGGPYAVPSRRTSW